MWNHFLHHFLDRFFDRGHNSITSLQALALPLCVAPLPRESNKVFWVFFFFPNLHFTQNYLDLYLGKVFLSLPLLSSLEPCPQVDRMHLSILIISFYGGQPFMLIAN